MGIYLNFNITWPSEFYLFEFLFKYFNLRFEYWHPFEFEYVFEIS